MTQSFKVALVGLADGKQKGQASDTNFAQQLSAAAGQQGVNGPQSLRADALQAQQASAPLQMARSDMAAAEAGKEGRRHNRLQHLLPNPSS